MNRDKYKDIDPDEIFLDSVNEPNFDTRKLEGRLEKSITWRSAVWILICFTLVGLAFLVKLGQLQLVDGGEYLHASETNVLDQQIIFAERGLIVDRKGEALAWNEATTTENHFPYRKYIEKPGFGHLLGYVRYPQKDDAGFYFQEEMHGVEGVEGFYDTVIAGENGVQVSETDATGAILSGAVVQPPSEGKKIKTTIDAGVQAALFEAIDGVKEERGFDGGAGVILDVGSGEVLAMVSAPEFSPQVMTDSEESDTISNYFDDPNNVFLNKAIGGLFSPGSTVKPFVAAAALDKKIITPDVSIYSSGTMLVPNPYDENRPTPFLDWKAHGLVDMRKALAVSSNIYFYHVGGGFEEQEGLGIREIESYVRDFKVGEVTAIDLAGEVAGVIPNPEWKEVHFPGDPWRVGDTYNTSIGQYGFQVTPIQMARGVAAIANGGRLVQPHINADVRHSAGRNIGIADKDLRVVREGMRQGVTEGTATGLSTPHVQVAAKSGTAQVGTTKQFVHSWVTGFFPYENPKYAFAIVMEHGPESNLVGASAAMRRTLDWMGLYTPEYFESD